MKIGIFDSGLGGLLITHSLISSLPDHDYIYLGDTARVPYGDRPQREIYDFTLQAVDYLFEQGCTLIVIACNTASAEALRKIQQEYLPAAFPTKRVLGVLIPAAEAAVDATSTGHIGLLATKSTVTSGAFDREVKKLDPHVTLTSVPAPLLVPMVELDRISEAGPALDQYLSALQDVDTLILGCTHYPYLKALIRQKLGHAVKLIAQDEILPGKLASYVSRHPELSVGSESQKPERTFQITKLTPGSQSTAQRLFAGKIELTETRLPEVAPRLS